MNSLPRFREKLDRPVVLVGMMGSGKTHIGLLLSEALGCPFLDTDAMIEKRLNLSIPEIFSQFGEEKFREAERSALAEALQGGACVVSTGGGIVMHPENRTLIREKGITIWLDVAPDILWRRVRENKNRPLLQTEKPEQTLCDLLNDRRQFYAQADLHLPIAQEPPDQVLNNALSLLSEHVNKDRF